MSYIEKPNIEIKFSNSDDYERFINYFENVKNGWKRTGKTERGYSKESNNSIPSQVFLTEESLKMWGMDSHEEEKLRKIAKNKKLTLEKTLDMTRGFLSELNKNARKSLGLE